MTVHRQVKLASETDFDGWRAAARALVLEGAPPQWVHFRVEGAATELFDAEAPPPPGAGGFSVPKRFVELAETVALHRDPERWDLLYRLLWRVQSERGLMNVATDIDVHRAEGMAKAVGRDIHKMRAFVRFREIAGEDGQPVHIAWFEPEHHIVERNSAFFVRRFAAMRWSILTPEASAHWDGEALTIGPGASKADAPTFDEMEEVWRAYYASIFNPARLKVNAMRSEMPQKYWKNLPEASLIPDLVANANRRMEAMVEDAPTGPRRPMKAEPRVAAPEPSTDLEAVRAAALDCRACPLWAPATQTVFGEGPEDASVMLVGEQPGDQEDLAGHPFVGPAGKVLDRALNDAEIERERVYVTNAVKHFKFVPRGKTRLHQKPSGGEVKACRQWFEKEVAIVRPKLVVALGATAAQQVFGRPTTIGSTRGRLIEWAEGTRALVTVHPSYLLRLPSEADKAAEYARFVADLKLARPLLAA